MIGILNIQVRGKYIEVIDMAKSSKVNRLVKVFRENTKIELAQAIVENDLDL